jgi:16S rRNA (cytidine1402-2'-O)-methyltransferase
MPGILYVVATPIGNLEDITLRALRVLRDVAVIAAEDTRRTARLLQHYSISTRTTSLHAHNERAKVPGLIARLEAGESMALVSDAGTPLISDPGVVLVSAAHAAGIRVEPVPGPSAALAAVSASGFPTDGILFVGFPPSKSSARKRWIETLADENRAIVFYEAPHRIAETLREMAAILGDRRIALGRELTKVHEELVVQPITSHLAALTEPRGEYTVVVSPPGPGLAEQAQVPDADALASEFGQLANTGASSRRQAIKALAQKYHVTAREVYRLIEEAKH